MSTLKLKKQLIIHNIIVFLIVSGLVYFNHSVLIPFPKFQDAGLFTWFSLGMIIFVDLFFIFITLATIFSIQTILKYQISFHPEFVEENRRLAMAYKPVKIFYNEITSIDYQWIDIILIKSNKGSTLRIPVKSSEGGKEKAISILMNHVPSRILPDQFPEKIQKIKPIQKIGYIGLCIISCLYLIFMSFQFGILSAFSVGWNVYEHWGARSVSGFWVDSPNSIWVVTDQFGNHAEVIHYESEKVDSWELLDLKYIQYSRSIILVDDNNIPTVIDRDGNVHILKKDNTWETVESLEENSLWLLGNYYASSKKEAWFIIQSDKVNNLAKITAGSNEIEFISLPKLADNGEYEPYGLFLTNDGSLLVLAEEDESIIFRLNNGQWSNHVYDVSEIENTIVRDVTLDKDGNLYILYKHFPLGGEYFVEIIRDNSRQITQIPKSSDDARYVNIEVDRNGRLWLTGGYDSRVSVLRPNWNSTASEIALYTESNSSYSGNDDIHPVLLSNGELWSGNDRLAWIDTNTETLPEPLPAWLAFYLNDNNPYRPLYPLFFLIFLFGWHQFISYKSRMIFR